MNGELAKCDDINVVKNREFTPPINNICIFQA